MAEQCCTEITQLTMNIPNESGDWQVSLCWHGALEDTNPAGWIPIWLLAHMSTDSLNTVACFFLHKQCFSNKHDCFPLVFLEMRGNLIKYSPQLEKQRR